MKVLVTDPRQLLEARQVVGRELLQQLVRVGDVGIGVVDDLDGRGLLGEEHRGAAGEELDVGLVRREQRRAWS